MRTEAQPSSASRPGVRAADAIAVAAFLALAALVLYLCTGPVTTADAWFHLAAGEAYVREGPWPAEDPLLFTAHEEAPVQHEWLFGVMVHAVQSALGFHGLRVVHLLLAALAIALAFASFRRASRNAGAAAGAASVFLLLAWYRLWQLRPDLVTIPATFLVYRLLIEERREPPAWRRVAGFALLMLVWANAHSLFAVGLLLLGAATIGFLLRGLAARVLELDAEEPRAAFDIARRLSLALLAGTAATLLNPRGPAQLLTFVTSTRASRIWAITDEWRAFVPWDPGRYSYEVSGSAWLATNLVLLGFALAAVVATARLLRAPSLERLRAADPVRLCLALAAIVALFTSVRFLWLAAFPLLYMLRAGRAALAAGGLRLALSSASLGLSSCVAFASTAGFAALRPPLAGYLADGYSVSAYPMAAGVRFLQEAGLEGRMYNEYATGGFVGYWLAPRLRTFIDGRTEHYPPAVFDDWLAVYEQRIGGAEPGFLELLDRREVDVFLGGGLPLPTGVDGSVSPPYPCLDGLPAWITLFRSHESGVYLRRGAPAATSNLERVERYYRSAGIPFDREGGVELERIVVERPEWAVEHGFLPLDHAALVNALAAPDGAARRAAFRRLGLAYALIGAHELGTTMERRGLALDPNRLWPRRRLIHGLIALGRLEEALDELAALESLAPRDAWAQLFRRAATWAVQSLPDNDWTSAVGRRLALNRLPLCSGDEYRADVLGRYRVLRPLPPARRAKDAIGN